VCGFIGAFVTTFVAMSLSYAVLSLLLWSWLAWLISAIGAMVLGHHAGTFMATSGYDHAVNGCASVLTFFRAVKAKAAPAR
jgi:hypothetical protein